METVGPAGCAANISYFRSLRHKYFEQALSALAEEKKWEQRLSAQKNFEETVKNLLTEKA